MMPKRPILRYHGGKWKLAPWIIGHFPPHRIYVEPYGGGASVLIRKPRSYGEIYNDLDGDIVNLFRMVRERGAELCRALELTPFARAEFLEAYEPSDDVLEQARRLVVRSFMGFGSLGASGQKTGFRADSNRSGTTPAHDWRNYPQRLPDLVERLQAVVIEEKDALAVMAQHDAQETLHYCDPPYVHETRSVGNPYCRKGYRHEMTDEAHRWFGGVVRDLRGMVVVSGYDSPLYDELFGDWQQVRCSAHADGARDRTEVLWLNPACVDALEASQAQQRLIA